MFLAFPDIDPINPSLGGIGPEVMVANMVAANGDGGTVLSGMSPQ